MLETVLLGWFTENTATSRGSRQLAQCLPTKVEFKCRAAEAVKTGVVTGG